MRTLKGRRVSVTMPGDKETEPATLVWYPDTELIELGTEHCLVQFDNDPDPMPVHKTRIRLQENAR